MLNIIWNYSIYIYLSFFMLYDITYRRKPNERINTMNILTVENISKSYGEKLLLNNICLSINEGDKIGLIGVNGTGKSTLLKIIAGLEDADEGHIVKGNTVSIEYLPQQPDFDLNSTVIEQVFKGTSPVMRLLQEYERETSKPNPSGDRILSLTKQMDSLNAWSIEAEAKSILTKLGINDFNARIGTLSGGQKKRIALATSLINPSDLLIMDEPTNHLDNDTIDWLEQYLNRRKGALLMVTHDRYFLDRITNHIIELDRGNLYVYSGNYSTFLEKKLQREELLASSERKRQNLLRKELEWIKRGAKARSTNQKARIQRFEELSNTSYSVSQDKIEISTASTRLGKKVIEIQDICKSFGNKELIKDFSYIVLKDDRVGIIGPNGCGKSTLINLISGALQPDKGTVEIGETVKMGVYSQETLHLDNSMRVIDYVKEGAEYASNAEGYMLSASQMLERFLFPGEMQYSLIGKLSGGEKRRLYLLRVLMEAPNVLLLDEPTNDLDIQTLSVLEDYIDEFQGAVIAVSHDRYFLDRICEKLFVFKGDGIIEKHTVNYTEWKEKESLKIQEESPENEKKLSQNKQDNKPQKEKPLKFSFKEQREYEEIDGVIASLEESIASVEKEIEDSSSDYTRLQELLAQKESLEQQLEEKMNRWVYLNELAEKIEANKKGN